MKKKQTGIKKTKEVKQKEQKPKTIASTASKKKALPPVRSQSKKELKAPLKKETKKSVVETSSSGFFKKISQWLKKFFDA